MLAKFLAPSRRDVLMGGTAATVLLLGQRAGAQIAAPRQRPDLATPAGTAMATLYEQAVRAMQDPAINFPPQPQSWTFQAYIHGVPINPFDPATSGGLRNGTPEMQTRIDQMYGNPAAGSPQAAWKLAAQSCWATCTHYSPYFPTWHRWYMYYFERICRAACKSPSFQLPYWNYASNIGSSLQLPVPFRSSANSRLYFDDRGLGYDNAQGTGTQTIAMNNGGYMPYPQIDYGPALSAKVMFPSDQKFASPPSKAYYAFGFSGRLECVPHDMVHDNVGGWMGNIPSAAGDPVFYMHHCQVDRLYASWEALPGVSYNWGTTDTQPSEKTWLGEQANFVDEKGSLIKVVLGGAVSTAALGYGYDSLAAPPPRELLSTLVAQPSIAAAPAFTMAAMRANNVTVGNNRNPVIMQESGAAPLTTLAPGAAGTPPRGASASLILRGIKLLRRPPAPLSVFVNLPKGAVPQLNDPYYVGTLSLFNFDLGTGTPMLNHGTGAAHAAPDGGEASFDVGDILNQQRIKGLWDGKDISVTITTAGADNAGTVTYMTIGSVTLLP